MCINRCRHDTLMCYAVPGSSGVIENEVRELEVQASSEAFKVAVSITTATVSDVKVIIVNGVMPIIDNGKMCISTGDGQRRQRAQSRRPKNVPKTCIRRSCAALGRCHSIERPFRKWGVMETVLGG